uniref:Uncharacterized protein n=1 Tax=Rhizophora mucronata TaxID=61149 RepID=A0A2P2PBS0_RHIMU
MMDERYNLSFMCCAFYTGKDCYLFVLIAFCC